MDTKKWDTYNYLTEVKAGKKVIHWIWYIFPQMKGLSISERSYYYGISDTDEATEYINHPVLRDRLIEITETVYNNEKSVYGIFGNDAIKVSLVCCFLPLFLIYLFLRK